VAFSEAVFVWAELKSIGAAFGVVVVIFLFAVLIALVIHAA
jgi:hypothetical protein